MSRNIKVKLVFKDRLGIVYDVSRCILQQHLNVICMEVEQQEGFAEVTLNIDSLSEHLDPKEILSVLSALPGVSQAYQVKRLPQEKREKWFRTLFDGMSEGIISVDAKGFINTANSIACRILNMPYQSLVNTFVGDIHPKHNLLMECLTKKEPVSRKRSVVTSTGRVEFYGSAKPIYNSRDEFVGAVLLMKNLKEVKAMVDAVMTPSETTFDDFIGDNKAIRRLIRFAKKTAVLDTVVSITGESGTGKELFARGIHYESGRSGTLIPINCAALPEHLIESELFGYDDGAFTGAKKRGKPGLFEAANNGTIFLDEIGDMPLGTQAKMLRVLQEGCIRRIGSLEEIPVNARIVTATNKNLGEMVAEGNFREDLFYRINVLTIQIPPLRDRISDVPLLAQTFLNKLNQKLQKSEQTISAEAMEKLCSYSWPGNVRELQNVIERAGILSDSKVVPASCVYFQSNGSTCNKQCQSTPQINGGASLKERIADYERKILVDVLNTTTSIRKAAQKLNISHTALINKIRKYNLCSEEKNVFWGKTQGASH